MNWKIKNAEELKIHPAGKYHPIVLKILASRGIAKEEDIESFFDFDYDRDLSDPGTIRGMKEAVERISEAKEKGEKVAIYGDYDADGVSASAVLHETLLMLGFSGVACYLPDRQLEGYGMNEKAIEYLAEKKTDLIITVDCGITNSFQAKKAKSLGMDVIITDHHHVPEVLPEAVSVINPNLSESGFSCRELAGVGVAFKLAQGLCRKMAPEKEEQLKWLLDLVALGTVADCVPLLGENRLLVKYGLVVLSKTRRVGLREIFQVGRIEINENSVPDAHKIAFQIAPRINAAGRMDHANTAYKLLVENDPVAARDLALELESKNQERQKVTGEIFREVEILAQNAFRDKKFICAENQHWPVGVLGLVAGKITEQERKPSLICQRRDKEFVGSLRSIPEVNIVELLGKCADLLEKFGGHSQAAGVTVARENFEKFYEKMSGLVEEELSGKETDQSLFVDCEISAEDIDWELVADLKKMEPFGMGNEEPVFSMRDMAVCETRIVGNGQKHLKLSLRSASGGPKIFEAIGFSLAEKFPEIKTGDRIDIVFHLCEDEWNGNKKIQLKIMDMRIV